MTTFYMLLITYPHSGQQHIMSTRDKAVTASEENKHLLMDMGRKLMDENIITSYTLMVNASDEVNGLTRGGDA